MSFPPIPYDVLAALEKQFPERTPDVGESHDKLMWRAGNATVVRFLRVQYDTQQSNILNLDKQDVHTET